MITPKTPSRPDHPERHDHALRHLTPGTPPTHPRHGPRHAAPSDPAADPEARPTIHDLIAQAAAANAAELAEHGQYLPTLADTAQAAYTSFGLGIRALEDDQPAAARRWLAQAVGFGVDEAAPLLALATAASSPGHTPEEPGETEIPEASGSSGSTVDHSVGVAGRADDAGADVIFQQLGGSSLSGSARGSGAGSEMGVPGGRFRVLRAGLSEVLDVVPAIGPVPAGAAPDAAVGHDRRGMSARERRILRLIADGRSEGEIGTTLCLSPRMIWWHLALIVCKLGPGDPASTAAGPPTPPGTLVDTPVLVSVPLAALTAVLDRGRGVREMPGHGGCPGSPTGLWLPPGQLVCAHQAAVAVSRDVPCGYTVLAGSCCPAPSDASPPPPAAQVQHHLRRPGTVAPERDAVARFLSWASAAPGQWRVRGVADVAAAPACPTALGDRLDQVSGRATPVNGAVDNDVDNDSAAENGEDGEDGGAFCAPDSGAGIEAVVTRRR